MIDISNSNKANIQKTFSEVNQVYLNSNYNDYFNVYFFSSVKYLAYSGNKLSKDRDFLPILSKSFQSAAEISVQNGTSFGVVKELIEKCKPINELYIFTDGFFENSNLFKIDNSTFNVYVKGLNISNNERVVDSFSNNKNITITY